MTSLYVIVNSKFRAHSHSLLKTLEDTGEVRALWSLETLFFHFKISLFLFHIFIPSGGNYADFSAFISVNILFFHSSSGREGGLAQIEEGD